jgi:hypothetical protein
LPRHEHVEVAVVGYAENADEHVLKEWLKAATSLA